MSDAMQKIKPEYTPVKRDTPSIEEHETVARKNERKGGIASQPEGSLRRPAVVTQSRCEGKMLWGEERRHTLTGSVLLEDGTALEKHR